MAIPGAHAQLDATRRQEPVNRSHARDVACSERLLGLELVIALGKRISEAGRAHEELRDHCPATPRGDPLCGCESTKILAASGIELEAMILEETRAVKVLGELAYNLGNERIKT